MKAILNALLLIAAFAPVMASAAPAMLLNMILSGKLAPSSDGKLLPVTGDTVLAVNAATGATEASAAFVSYGVANGKNMGGAYTLIMANMPASYNGTPFLLRLSHQNAIYSLLDAGSVEATFNFNGSFLPIQAVMDLTASSQLLSGSANSGTGTGAATGSNPGSGTGTGAATGSKPGYSGSQYIYITVPASGTPATGNGSSSGTSTGATAPAPVKGDLNGDFVANSLDINLLKQAISGQIPLNVTTMDINADGVVNTRDLIDLIGIVRNASVLVPGVIVVAPVAIVVVPKPITRAPIPIVRTPIPIVRGR